MANNYAQCAPDALDGKINIGETTIVTLVANTWTEVVLQSLANNPRPYPARTFCIKSSGTVYIAQASDSLEQDGSVVALPANPATATSGTAAGNFELLANTYYFFDVSRLGENSIWLYSTGTPTVRISNICETPYGDDDANVIPTPYAMRAPPPLVWERDLIGSGNGAPATTTAPGLVYQTFYGQVEFVILVRFFTTAGATDPFLTTPTGWTLLTEKNDGTRTHVSVWYRTISDADQETLADSSPPIWTWTRSAHLMLYGDVIANVDPTSPIDASTALSIVSPSGDNFSVPGITSVHDGALLAILAYVKDNTGDWVDGPSLEVCLNSQFTTGAAPLMGMGRYYKQLYKGGAVPAQTITYTGGAGSIDAFVCMIAFRPGTTLAAVGSYALLMSGETSDSSALGTPLATNTKYFWETSAIQVTTSLTTARSRSAACGNATLAIIASGYNSVPALIASTEKFTYSTEAVSAGTALATARDNCNAASNSTTGIFMGGYNGSFLTSSETYTFATDVRAAGGTMPTASAVGAAQGNALQAIYYGGTGGVIQKYTYATNTFAAVATAVLYARERLPAAFGNSAMAWFAYGWNVGGPTIVNTIDQYTYATAAVVAVGNLVPHEQVGDAITGMFPSGAANNSATALVWSFYGAIAPATSAYSFWIQKISLSTLVSTFSPTQPQKQNFACGVSSSPGNLS